MTITAPQPSVAAHASPSWWERQSDRVMQRPFNEWTFTHMHRLLPTAPVRRGPVARPWEHRPARLPDLTGFHRRTHTTAFVVLHRGRIVHEAYPGWFAGPRTRMQLFSLSKSVTSVLVGAALADGAIGDVADKVTTYRPDFLGTAYDGVTVGDLLDMCSGAGEQEVWGADTAVRRFERAVLNGGDVEGIVRSAPRTGTPGERFNYSTFDAQLLGWVVEAATGMPLAAYAAHRLWGPIGAEQDAYYCLSRSHPRTAIGAGGFNATARDLARVGQLMIDDGVAGNRRVVPAQWARRSRGAGVPHLAVGALGPSGEPHYGYANQWWTLGGGQFTGVGVHGQYLFVDPAAEVVIVKCSAWPVEEDPARDRGTIDVLRGIAAAL